MPKKKTKEQFIKEAKLIHNDKYDYDKVNYINDSTKIEIYCKKCKKYFFIRPNTLLKGSGCQSCGYKNRKNNKLSLENAIEKYGSDKFDYSKFVYINESTKSKIICKNCNTEFSATIKAKRCPKCDIITNEKCLSRFRKVHGEIYDYSKVNYKNRNSKVIIICKKHGEFLQEPISHWNGEGCPECKREALSLSSKEFFERVKNIYGDFFDLSETIWKNTKTPFFVKCPKHGLLKKDYEHFIRRQQGCFECYKEKILNDIEINYNGSNYKNDYDNLINNAKKENRKKGEIYYEKHHILPKSLGGNNKKENLVLLTREEHFLAHFLLWKITKTPQMEYAFLNMVKSKVNYNPMEEIWKQKIQKKKRT